MVRYKQSPNVIVHNCKPIRKRKAARKSDIVIQNWHLECHEEGSRLWKLTMALAEENSFNDLDVIAYGSDDCRMLSHEIGA